MVEIDVSSLNTFFLEFINPGIISLCRPDGKGVQSLLGVFCLPSTDVRVSFQKHFPYSGSSFDGEKYIVLVNIQSTPFVGVSVLNSESP